MPDLKLIIRTLWYSIINMNFFALSGVNIFPGSAERRKRGWTVEVNILGCINPKSENTLMNSKDKIQAANIAELIKKKRGITVIKKNTNP